MTPPSAHAMHIHSTLPAMPATMAGDLKMPVPITTPTIKVIAPRRLSKGCGRSYGKDAGGTDGAA
jgi:hypothetical protein